MAPTSQAATNQLISAAQANGAQQQNALNAQSQQLQGNYANYQNQANTAYQNAQQATQGIQDAGQLYGQDLTAAQQQYGFNPQDLATAVKNLTAQQNIMAALPQAASQQGGGYGTTAGQTANLYANEGQNQQAQLTNATNSVGNLQSLLGATQNQANQQAGLSAQSQQAKAAAANNVYQNAVAQMSSAGSTMAQIEGLQQQQGYLTSEQVANYQNAYNGYINAQAAATAARGTLLQGEAAVTSANASAQLQNQQYQQLAKLFASSGVNIGDVLNNPGVSLGGAGSETLSQLFGGKTSNLGNGAGLTIL